MDRPPQKLPMGKPLPPQGSPAKPPQRQSPQQPNFAPGPQRTPPRTSGGSILLILLAIFGGAGLLAMLACGGFVWYVGSSVNDEIARQEAAQATAAQEALREFERQQRNNNQQRPNNKPWQPPRPSPVAPAFNSAEQAAAALDDRDHFRKQRAMQYLREQPRSDKAVPMVLAQMNNRDSNVRRTARELLTKWEVDEAAMAKQNLADLKSGEDDRAREASKWFAEHVIVDEELSPQVSGALVALISNRNTRNDAVAALEFWATADSVPALVDAASVAHAANDRDAERACVQLLTSLNDARALPTYAAYLDARHDRTVARAAFAAIGEPGAKALLPFVNHEDSSVRQIARELLAEWEIASTHLVTQSVGDLESGEQNRQSQAMRYLSDIEPGDADREVVAQALIGMVDDQRLRHDALRSLKKWATTSTVPKLIELLDHEDRNVSNQARAILVETKDPRAVAPIAAGFGDDFFKRTEARRNLVAMGPVAESALWPHVTDKNWQVAKDACEILGEIGTSKSIPILHGAAAHNSSFVKNAATNAIKRIEAADREAGPMPVIAATDPTDDGTRKMRTWTDASGANKMEAMFIEFKLGKVRLRTRQGRSLSLKLDQLSAADREYVIKQVQRGQ